MLSNKIPDVISSINAIGEIGFHSKKSILQAEHLFNEIPFGERERVTNCQKLIDARAQFEKLKLLTVEKNETGCTIIAAKKRISGELIIPSSVTVIGAEAFKDCKRIRSVIIPSSITEIGPRAFVGCSRLERICVLEGNKRYRSVDNCLIEIENKTLFLGCKNSIIPSDGSVTKIGHYAFCKCKGLKELVIPSSIEIIDWYAFFECRKLKTISIPNSVKEIGSGAFWGCSKLSSIKLPNALKKLERCIFNECSNLLSIEISHTVRIIEEHAFSDCRSLSSVKMSAALTRIESYAFANCERIKKVIIPYRVWKLGSFAFYGCSSLEKVVFQSKKAWWIKMNLPIISGIVMNVSNAFDNAKSLKRTYESFEWCTWEEKNNIFL